MRAGTPPARPCSRSRLSSRSAAAKADLDKLAADAPAGYAALARLAQAGLAAKAGDTPRALGVYRAIADDSALRQPLRDLAGLRAIMLEYDSLAPDVAITRLRPFAKPGGPWFGVAGELTALAHLAAGRPKEGAAIIAAVARDPNTPQALRGRAEQLAGALGVELAPIKVPQS